jgi:predicted GNAT family N-acyltransferase
MDLKLITKEDLEWARQLRNKNRKWFITKKLISETEQKVWFKTIQKQDDIHFYVIWLNGERVGTISVKLCFGYNEKYVEIHNVLIAEEFRGRKLTKKALKELKKLYPCRFRIEALLDNPSVYSVYFNVGFKPRATVLYD